MLIMLQHRVKDMQVLLGIAHDLSRKCAVEGEAAGGGQVLLDSGIDRY